MIVNERATKKKKSHQGKFLDNYKIVDIPLNIVLLFQMSLLYCHLYYLRHRVYKELQQAMLSLNSQNEGYMLWLDHSKLPLGITMSQYFADRPQILPWIPARYRGATAGGSDEPLLTAKQVARQSSLESAAADIASVAHTMVSGAERKVLNTSHPDDVRSIQEITEDFQV